ncbi:MAG: LLM class flavin-dependent oxidoreductase, partial [Rhodospirillales bacterium]|nr:LLM class flavin-dependent oxidoreductase [Rhodospirillales bacterium]
MNTPSHMGPGLWCHPRNRTDRYTDLDYWVGLAELLERGRFDGIFLADVLGVYDVYGGTTEHALRHGVQAPVNDPSLLVPAMAHATEHLGFGVTCSTAFEHPYPFARRMTTLDHLTKGRIGWNVVTSYLESGARNLGQATQGAHDDRYDVADEYMEVCYKLWEGSWEDGAARRDREGRVFADPSKIHPIAHAGRHYTVPGIHIGEPSPQRTPVIYQAGSSSRGRQFAARHAECVFTAAPTLPILKSYVSRLREALAAEGRDPRDTLVFNMQTVLLGETDAEAARKAAEYREWFNYEGALTLMSGWTGIDFSGYAPDEALRYVKTNAGQSAVESFSTADPARTWTVREMAEWCAIGGRGPVIVGSPTTVADALQTWIDESDADGFNLSFAVSPGDFVDVVEMLVPELQKRGVFKRDYAAGTLRHKLFGAGPALKAT